jgi:parallel beta-helix repeat protein
MITSIPTQRPGGNTYYVATDGNDADPGTQSQPWKTIQKAANTMVAGDIVIIQNGIYRESVDLTGSTGVEGESGNETQGYISYIGESRDGVIIDGAGLPWGSGFMSGVIAKGKRVVNYIKISKMTIQNFLADGVEFYADKGDGSYPRIASHNIILDNLKVHNNTMGGIMFCGGEEPYAGYNFIVRNSEVYNNHGAHHGIKFSGDPRAIYNGEHIHDSIIENNLVYNNDELGIHNSSGNYNIIIRNNIVHDNGRQGIAGNQVWDSIYANNTVYSNGKLDSTSADGIVIWSSRNITITGNMIYNNPGYGIEIPSALGDGKPANPIVTNNVIYNNLGGIQFSAPVSGGVIYNNIIASNTRAGLFFYSTTTGNTVKNNIFYQNTNQLWDSSGNTYDYNLYYPNISFASKGIHDISGDPMFIDFANVILSLRNYHLKSTSPAIDAGYNLGSLVTNDFDGITRPRGSGYDIGAYEFSSP